MIVRFPLLRGTIQRRLDGVRSLPRVAGPSRESLVGGPMSASNRHSLAGILRMARLANPTPDAEILARFAEARDEAAFAALVERHGPMVLGVCRRVLGDHHTA